MSESNSYYKNYPKDTGIPSSASTASLSGGGGLVSGVSNRNIVITDILASEAVVISTALAWGGAIIAYAPAGPSNLTAGIVVPDGSGIYSAGGDITINYYIQ